MKVKFNAAGIKNFLLQHGEKLAFGVVGACVLMLVYSALTREVLDPSKAPDKLKSLAGTVQQHVANSAWDPKREELQVVDYADRAVVKEVKAASYAVPNLLSPPVVDPKSRRSLPEVVAVEELRVGAGFDVFEVKGTAGKSDRNLAAQPWVVITAAVPFERQKQEYAKAFAAAVGANATRDVPVYLAPIVERAEFDAANPDTAEWKPMASSATFEAQWLTKTQEELPKEYVDPALTAPLGPLVNNRVWGEAISHPRIRALVDAAAAQANAPPPEPEVANARPVAARGPRMDNRARPAATTTDAKNPPYRLLRAFDYAVEPGKRYRYRVALVLENPNQGVAPQFLKDPQSAALKQLAGNPSSPSSVVTVPDGHQVLAGAVDPGTRYSEPTATMLVTAVDRAQGLEPAVEMTKVLRGGLANVGETEVKVIDPRDKQVKQVKHAFQSNILVLDMYGGEDLPGPRRVPAITAPAELLLLGPDGNMVVRSELDDLVPYENSLVRDARVEKKKPLDDDSKRRPSRPPARRPGR